MRERPISAVTVSVAVLLAGCSTHLVALSPEDRVRAAIFREQLRNPCHIAEVVCATLGEQKLGGRLRRSLQDTKLKRLDTCGPEDLVLSVVAVRWKSPVAAEVAAQEWSPPEDGSHFVTVHNSGTYILEEEEGSWRVRGYVRDAGMAEARCP
jgi:hypothetical protein